MICSVVNMSVKSLTIIIDLITTEVKKNSENSVRNTGLKVGGY